jgi:fucose 4-O-acetylase-like acetyltransferase
VSRLRWIAIVYMLILLAAASLNYIPGLTDAEGRAFGVFALDIYDDALHVASAIWAGVAAALSTRASRIFLRYFGLLYLTDGLLGLVTG